MVVRPSDWFLVGLPVDPTPGDAFGIRALASKYGEIAQIAGEASTGVRHARSSGAASAWVGDAGDIFRDRSERMPGELAKANDSYELVAEALRVWAAAVDDTQAQADRGLQQAREAHHDLSAAQAALASAEWSWTTAHAQQLTYQTLKKAYSIVPPPPGVTMPTDYQLRSVDRSAQHAQASIASAQHAVADADARLAAARRLVLDAKAARDDAERRTVHQIHEAQGQAVKPSSVWEAIQDSAAWQAIVVIATVVLTIVSIVAIFVGGPLVWALIIAATVLLLVNALMSIAQGKDAWGELALLAIGLIPGGRLLALGAGAARVASAAFRASSLAMRLTPSIERLTSLVARGGELIQALKPAEAALDDAVRDGDDTLQWVGSMMSQGKMTKVFTDGYVPGTPWVSPMEDLARVVDPVDAAIQSGLSDGVINQVINDKPVYAVMMRVEQDVLRNPTAQEFGGVNSHFLEGEGHTGYRIQTDGDPLHELRHVNPTRELVLPQDYPVKPGDWIAILERGVTDAWGWKPVWVFP